MTRAAELPLRLDTKMFLVSEEEDSKIDVFEVYGLSNSTTTVIKIKTFSANEYCCSFFVLSHVHVD